MQKFFIDKLLLIWQSIRILGQNDFISVVMYSEIVSIIWRTCIWILGIFSLQFQIDDTSFGLVKKLASVFLGTYSTIGYVLDLFKVLIVFGVLFYKIDSPIFIKKFFVVCFILFQDNCFMIDMVTVQHQMNINTGFYIVYSILSTIICSTIRLFSDLTMCNFSFNYNHKSKRIPLLKIKIFQSITQQITCIFLMIMHNRTQQSYFIIFTLLFVINFLAKANYIYSLPFSSSVISKLRIIKFVIWSSFILSFIVSHSQLSLVSSNIWIIFFTINILWIVFSMNFLKMKKQKMLITDIKTLSNWKQANIKLQHYYELISQQKISINKITALLQFHIKDCKKVDCYCRRQNPQDFRYSNCDIQIVTLKYFLLVLCQQTSNHFQYQSTAQIYKLIGLSLLNIYPKLLFELQNLQETYSLKLIDKVMSKYLKWQVLQLLQKRNQKQKILNIQVLEEIQTLNQQLVISVKKVAKYRQKLFQTLTNNSVFSQNVQKIMNCQVIQRKKTQQIFQKIQKIPYLQAQSMKLLVIYAHNIIQNPIMEKKIKHFISEQKGCRATSDYQNLKLINRLIKQSNNSCHLKLSLINSGKIEWHDSNLFEVFNLQKNTTVIGQNINILVPDFFKDYHSQIMDRWTSNPSDKFMKNCQQTLIEIQPQKVAIVTMYLKIIPKMQQFIMFCLVNRKPQNKQIMLLNSKLQLVYSSEYLNNFLNQDQITLNYPINLGLISQQFQSLLNTEIIQQSKIQFDIFIPHIYDDYYLSLQEQLSKLNPSLQTFNQSYKLLLRKIHFKMRSSKNIIVASLRGKLSIMNKLQLSGVQIPKFYIITQIEPNSSEKQQDDYSSSQQLSLDTSHEFDMVTNNSSSECYYQHSYQRIIDSDKYQNKIFRKIIMIIFFCVILCILAPPLIVFSQYKTTKQIYKIYDASVAINHIISLCISTYDMALTIDYHIKVNKRDPNLAKLFNTQITNIIESTKKYSYWMDNEDMVRFLNSNILTNKERTQPYLIFIQSWTSLLYKLCDDYKNPLIIKNSILSQNTFTFQKQARSQLLCQKIQRSQQKLMNIFTVLVVLVMTSKVVGFVSHTYYINYVDKYKFQMIKLLEQIDFSTISQYISFYKFCKKNIWNIDDKKPYFLNSENLKSNNHNKPKFVIKRTEIKSKIMLGVALISVIGSIGVISLLRGNTYNPTDLFSLSWQFQNTKQHLSKSLVQLKQVISGYKLVNQTKSLNIVVSDNFNHRIPSLIGASLIKNLPQKNIFKFINPLCSVVFELLTQQQRNICAKGFNYRLIDTGILSFGDYTTNNIRKMYHSLSSITPKIFYEDHHIFDSSLSMFFQQKFIFSLQQSTIRKKLESQRQQLKFNFYLYLIFTCFTGIILIWRSIVLWKSEKQSWKFIYKLPMIIPERVSRQNKKIQRFLNKLRNDNVNI